MIRRKPDIMSYGVINKAMSVNNKKSVRERVGDDLVGQTSSCRFSATSRGAVVSAG